MATPIYWSDAIEAIKEAIAILVADLTTGEILACTRPLELMFGYGIRGELVGRNVDELVPSEYKELHKNYRANYAANPSERWMNQRQVLHGHRKDGTQFPAQVLLSASIMGNRRCVVALVLDVTDRPLVSVVVPATSTITVTESSKS